MDFTFDFAPYYPGFNTGPNPVQPFFQNVYTRIAMAVLRKEGFFDAESETFPTEAQEEARRQREEELLVIAGELGTAFLSGVGVSMGAAWNADP